MNPVPVMPLVEIIEHNRLHHSALDFARQFCESLQKQVIKCQDSPGFIVNRLLLPMINQAIILLEQGIATVEDIDIAMRLGANFPMGPLTLADFIGLDTCLFILQTLYQEGDNNFVPPSNLLVNMVKDGKLGKKSGKGFYNYISIA
jgi:3-hydroxybutyryl-CoA dehydrogenase